MGKSRTPKYTVELYYANKRTRLAFPMEWRIAKRGQAPGYGRPTPENLARYVAAYNETAKPGGYNESGGPAIAAQICLNGTRQPVARYATVEWFNFDLYERELLGWSNEVRYIGAGRTLTCDGSLDVFKAR